MPVFEALVTVGGIDGDRQRDPRFHGGPERAVVLFSLDVIRALQREGHPIDIGTTGENLTVSGIDWAAISPGVELEIGGSFLDDDFTRISQKLHAGWSRLCAGVVTEGIVRAGDQVELVEPNSNPQSLVANR